MGCMFQKKECEYQFQENWKKKKLGKESRANSYDVLVRTEDRLLRRQWAFDLVAGNLTTSFDARFLKRRQIEVKHPAATLTGAGTAAAASASRAAVVVAAFVAAQSLAGGEGLEADGALVGLAGGGWPRPRSGRRVVWRRRFAVAGLVAAQGLVGGEGLAAYGALVGGGGELGRR